MAQLISLQHLEATKLSLFYFYMMEKTLNLVALEVGGEATLVTDGGGVEAVLVLDEGIEVVVGLAAHAKSLAEAGGADGQDHEFLLKYHKHL